MTNKLFFYLKLLLTFVIFALVCLKIDVSLVLKVLEQIKIVWLLVALIILGISCVLGAARFNVYLAANEIKFSQYFTIALYFVGMLYNNVLPGGIGGDGYKVYIIAKLRKISKLLLLRLILSDRANGLFTLIILTILLISFSSFIDNMSYSFLLIVLFTVCIIGIYLMIARKVLKEHILTSIKALKYSIGVQLFSLISAVFILKSLNVFPGVGAEMMGYLIIFMISSIVAIIPISIGGAGLRELTFIYGAQYLNFDADLGVSFALIYFCINLLLSTIGIFFMHNLYKIDGSLIREKV